MPDATPLVSALSDEDSIARNWDPTPAGEPAEASPGFAAPGEPAALTTELPSASDEVDLYALDDTRERENAELREHLLKHEIFSEFPRLKGKETLLYAAVKALDGQGLLQIRNGSPAEISRVAKTIGTEATKLLAEISKEVARDRPAVAASLVMGGSFPPGYFKRAQQPQEPKRFVDTIKRRQLEMGLYDTRPHGMSDAEVKRITRERLKRSAGPARSITGV